ncbi:MAG: phosphate acyltransferase PlsX [Oscillibacter sp.]|jgi:glycerol-3-phosphate acyltransferase PlsX|nr:phosphate acyltransferase PlsX [Oscillibacter sp.]
MKIIVDAMGGDNAPLAVVQGALEAHREYGTDVILVGRMADILKAVEQCGEKNLPAGVEIRDATEVVEIADDPATAFKRKKDSSLSVGLGLLREGDGDAFVSAGSTGALLAGATLVVKRIRGIRRAAMGPVLPTAEGRMLLCDCGANAECTPEYLLQFAYLGNYYAKRVLGVEAPRVALLNIGAEAEKGDPLRQETHGLLTAAAEAGRIRFVGNLEASEAMLGGADVLVADGFSGNIMLKSLEGTSKFLLKELKKVFLSSAKTKIAAGLVKGDLAEMKRLLDPSEVGGTPFLGISKPVIKAHGSSDARAIRNAILRAEEYAASGFIGDIQENIELMKVGGDRQKLPDAP